MICVTRRPVSRSAQLILLLVASLLPSSSLLAGLAFLPHAAAVQPLSALDSVEIYADGFGDLRGIVVDPQGNVFVADRARGAVTRLSPDGKRTRVARGLAHPIGLALDPAGRLLIAEERAGRVVRVEANGSRTVLVAGVKQPRSLAVLADGTLFISARRLTRDTDPEPDDESDEPEMILQLTPAGQLHVFADGFKHLQGLAANHQTLFAATQGRRGEARPRGDDHGDGVIVQIPILGDGTAGVPAHFGPANQFTKPVGLVGDRLGALYLTTKELDLPKDEAKRAVAKLHPTGIVTRYAEKLDNPQGVAFDPDGNLYVADGHSGRVLRFRAPPAPTVSAPAVTNQSPLAVTGTTLAEARVALFANDALTPVTVTANATGAFSASIALNANAATTFEVFATTHGGQGLTSAPAEATIIHDSIAPAVSFQALPVGDWVLRTVTVQAQATDPGSGLASLALKVDGQTLSAVIAPTLPAPTATATATWTTTLLADGTHTLGAIATDQAGNTGTTRRVVHVDNTPPNTQITGGPTGATSNPTVTFSFTGTDNLTPAASLLFAWRLDGGAWSEFTATTTATFANLAPGRHTFEAKARDLAGNEEPTPARQSFTVAAGVLVRITSPADGATVSAELLLVTGTVEANGAEVAIIVNGVPAALEGTVFAAQVGVSGDTSTLTAVATTAAGVTAMHTIAVTVTGDAAAAGALLVTPQSGVGPLTVRLSLAGISPRAVALDLNGDGTVDFTGVSLDDQSFTYTQPGLYFPIAIVTDAAGAQRVFRTVVQVYDRPAIDGVLRAKWNGMKSALALGNSEGALGFFTDMEQGRYRAIFTALSPHLAGIAQEIGDIELIYVVEGRAKYRLLRTQLWGGQLMTLTYYVYFVQDGSGFWRIEGF